MLRSNGTSLDPVVPNYHFIKPSLLINAIIPMPLNKVITHDPSFGRSSFGRLDGRTEDTLIFFHYQKVSRCTSFNQSLDLKYSSILISVWCLRELRITLIIDAHDTCTALKRSLMSSTFSLLVWLWWRETLGALDD